MSPSGGPPLGVYEYYATESHTGTTGSSSESSFSWSHNHGVSLLPRGILIFVATNAAVDDSTSVTYGGMTIPRVVDAIAIRDTGGLGDDCAVAAFFLGSGLPTGNQTVVVNRNNTANVMYATCITCLSTNNVDLETWGLVTEAGGGGLRPVTVDDGTPPTYSQLFGFLNSGHDGHGSVGFADPYVGAEPIPAPGGYIVIDYGSRGVCAAMSPAGIGPRQTGFLTQFQLDDASDHAVIYLAVREVFGPSPSTSISPSSSTSASYSPSASGSRSPSASPSFSGSASPSPSPTDGGGSAGTGTNPTQGTLPTSTPLIFISVRLTSGTTYVWSEVDEGHWADRPVWYGGFKAGRIIDIGRIRRELSEDGGFRAYTWTVDLDDRDRQLRIAAEAGSLNGAYVAFYVIDDADRRLENDPFRFAAGIITNHRPMHPGMRYQLTLSGALGLRLSDLNRDSKIPVYRYLHDDAPGMDTNLEGLAAQICMGRLSDETEANPVGVVPPRYVGYGYLDELYGGTAAHVMADIYFISMGAMSFIYNCYYSPPVWGDQEVHELGDLIRPADDTVEFYYVCTQAGTTGESEPEWPITPGASIGDGSVTWQRASALDPLLRFRVPDEAYGTVLTMPFKAGWTAASGRTTNYLDAPTTLGPRRVTLMFVLRSHRYARALREGRIQFGINLDGLAQNADGTGAFVDTAEESVVFILTNELFNTEGLWTTYGTIPTFTAPEGPYSVIDTDTFADALTVAQGFLPPNGYQVGFLLGRDGSQQSAFQVIAELCGGTNLDLGENVHGQVIASRENPDALAVATFDDLDIETGTLEMDRDAQRYMNRLEYRYAYRYAAVPWPAQPWNSKLNALHPFTSGLLRLETVAAQTAIDRVVTAAFDNYVVRSSAVAYDVYARLLQTFQGPAPAYNGARMIKFTTGWQGLQNRGVNIDLGVVIAVIVLEGFVQTALRVQVRAMEIEAIKDRVTIEGRVLSTVVVQSPSVSPSPSPSAAEAACTSVISYDFSTMTGPLYPTSAPSGDPDDALPNYWQNPILYGGIGVPDPYLRWYPALADYINLLRAENMNVIGGWLTWVENNPGIFLDPISSRAIFGDPIPGSDSVNPAFTTWGVNRTIFAETVIRFDSVLYDDGAWLVPYGFIFRVFNTRISGANNAFELAVEDVDGTSATLSVRLSATWIGAGTGTADQEIYTVSRAALSGSTHTVRIEMRPSSPQDPNDTQNFEHNSDAVFRLIVDGTTVYENTSGYFVPGPGYGLADMTEAYTVGGIGVGDVGIAGSHQTLILGYCDGLNPPHAVWGPNGP